MANSTTTDMTHLPNPRDPSVALDVPARGRSTVKFLGSIVEAVTAAWETPLDFHGTMVRCRRRPNRKPCTGHINARVIDVPSELHWTCDTCEDHGVILNWRGCPWDLSSIVAFEDEEGDESVSLDVNEEEYEAIRSILVLDEVAERVVRSARGSGEGDVFFDVPARWMEHLLEFVASEANHAGSRKVARLLGSVLDKADA